MVWRFTSPLLAQLGEDVLRECPVGKTLRETPVVYSLLRAGSYAENAGVEMLAQPRYIQDACALVAAERARLRELDRQDKQAEADARHGASVLRRGR